MEQQRNEGSYARLLMDNICSHRLRRHSGYGNHSDIISTINRVIGRVDHGRQHRQLYEVRGKPICVASQCDQTRNKFWTVGAVSGVQYITLGSTDIHPALATLVTNLRGTTIFRRSALRFYGVGSYGTDWQPLAPEHRQLLDKQLQTCRIFYNGSPDRLFLCGPKPG